MKFFKTIATVVAVCAAFSVQARTIEAIQKRWPTWWSRKWA